MRGGDERGEMRGGMRGRKQNLRRERERACQPTSVTIIHHHKQSGKHMHAHALTHTRMHAYTLAIGRSVKLVCTSICPL